MKESERYDVVVVGGGSAGLVAAVQAARAGAKTLLVEKSGILGGTAVLAGVNFPGLFHAWGKQVIAGIGWEWVLATVKEMGGQLRDFTQWRNQSHPSMQIRVDKAVYAALADKMLVDSGAEILFHTMCAEVKQEDWGWRVALCTKEGLRRMETRVLVDATGDANVVRQAGLPLRKSAHLQPGTLSMFTGGYSRDDLDYPVIEKAFAEKVAKGEMFDSDFLNYLSKGHAAEHFLRDWGRNAMHVTDIDGETSEGKTHAELKARAAMLRIIQFFRSQPGLGNFTVEYFSTECGVRETVTVYGEKTIRDVDYVSGRVWEDSLCHSFYPIDVHTAGGETVLQRLQEGSVPTIPLGALLPKDSRNLIVAGRIASGDQKANSAYRVQASCMAMGQVAGAAAALAAAGNVELRDVPLDSIEQLLKKHGAIVPLRNSTAR